MENEYHVDFIGPFSWLGHEGTSSIFDAPEGKKFGIYLWTAQFEESELVHYVGKTNRSFSQRMKEHFEKHLAGFYHVYSPEEFKKGERKPLWRGMYLRRKTPPIIELAKIYPIISGPIIEMANTYRFFIAPLKTDKRILERIEHALYQHLEKQPGKIGAFQESGLNYRKRFASEQPAIAVFNSTVKILGLPKSLEV